jgi:hypothetical protein
VAALSLNTAVTITQQPASQTVNPGANVTFTVAATGTDPLTYQWKFSGSPIGGATTASLTLNNVTAAQAGAYTVEVGNVVGTVASAAATLSLNTAVTITQQPASQTVNPGANVTFTVAAAGTGPFTYQWKFNGSPLAGATAASLTLNNVSAAQAGAYTVEVGNVVGTVASAAATLSLNTAVTITQQPASQTVNPGANVTFTVAAAGTGPLTYQWKFNGSPLAGATAASLTLNNVSAAQAGAYTVEVGNVVGTVASSAAALSLVTQGLAITQQPASQGVNPGGSVTFTVAATGTAPLTYQWKFNGSPIGGATLASLTLNNVSAAQAGAYTVEVGDASGTVASAAAVLTLNTPVTITQQPTSQMVAQGGSVTFTVAATGTAPLTYQWKSNGSPIAGATASSLTLTNVADGDTGFYSVDVGNVVGTVASSSAMLVLSPFVNITQQPASQMVGAGFDATFSVVGKGPGPITYQWRFNGVPIAGAVSATLVVKGVTKTNAGVYTVVVGNPAGTVTSAAANLVVTAASTLATVLVKRPEGVFLQLVVEGPVGATCRIQAAANLGQAGLWQTRATLILTGGSMVWLDPEPMTQPRRFYRLEVSQ